MKIICLLFTSLLLSLGAWADTTKELYVGETYHCNATTYMNLSYAISSVNWEVDASKLHYSESGWDMAVAPTKYYDGEAIVKCSWVEKDQRAPIPYPTYYRSYTWRIQCKDNPIIIDKTEIKLQPEETGEINARPTETSIHYYYNCQYDYHFSTQNSGIATVSQQGTVTAVGPGTTYIIVSSPNAQNDAKCKIIVENINVETATIPSSIELLADQTKTLTVSVTPNDATIKTQEWTSADTGIASIERSTGKLTGVWPGKTKVWCVVNGTVKSNEAEVTVTEPSFSFKEFSLPDDATEVETKPTLSAEFSHALSRGDNYDDIALTDGNGQRVDGTLTISGTKLTFTPSKHLQPTTNYTWTIPTQAVKNKWGTPYRYLKKLSFTTTDWKQMTLTVEPDVKYIARGEQIVLTCSAPDAAIYYSTDGSTPSKLYTGPLTFEDDMTLQAIAKLDGYYDSPELTHNYLRSVDIVERFPGENPLYNYADVNPYIVFSQQISQGTLFNGISMKKDGYETVACEVLIHDKTLFLVPVMPLELGGTYQVSLPESTLVTVKGEANKAIEWTFATGDYATAVSIGGPELTAAIKTDGSLWTWGKRITEANAEDGSYSYTTQTEPSRFIAEDVVAASSGYMHHAVIKRDGTLWMWGRQLCGEFGNGSTTASAQPVKVMSDVKSVSCGLQTTAIVKQDGTLWMCGRNDLGQIDESRVVKQQFVKVADDVREVTLNWGSMQIVKADGTIETRTWDDKADSNRKPVEPSNVTSDYAEVLYGWKNAVALKENGSVWTWDDSSADATPQKVIEGRISSELNGLKAVNPTITIAEGEKSVLTALPVPLTADYATMTWTDSGNGVAKVNNRGVVTGLKKGIATITAEIASATGHRFSQKFTVIVGEENSLKGDVNGDDAVDIADAVSIVNYVVGKPNTNFNEPAADVNNDGVVDIADAVHIVNFVVGKISTLSRPSKPEVEANEPQ